MDFEDGGLFTRPSLFVFSANLSANDLENEPHEPDSTGRGHRPALADYRMER